MGDRRHRVRGDEGQAIAELVIVAPVLLVSHRLMVALGRIDSAQGDVESAARAGVQAAVVQADAADGPDPGDRRLRPTPCPEPGSPVPLPRSRRTRPTSWPAARCR